MTLCLQEAVSELEKNKKEQVGLIVMGETMHFCTRFLVVWYEGEFLIKKYKYKLPNTLAGGADCRGENIEIHIQIPKHTCRWH